MNGRVSALVALLLAGLGVGQVDYSAPPECPRGADFMASVRAQSTRTSSTARRVPVSVWILPTQNGYLGELEVAYGVPRRVSGASCDAVVRGLETLAVALIRAEHEKPRAEVEEARVLRPGTRRPPPTGPELLLGADVAASWGVVPGVNFVVPLFGEIVWPGGTRLRLVFRRASTVVDDLFLGNALFTWTVGRVELCPLEADAEVMSASLCAAIEGGSIEVETAGLLVRDTDPRPWVALGALGRIRFPVVDGQLFVEASGGAVVPLVRQRYLIGEDEVLHAMSAVALEFGGGAGIVF